MPRATITTTRFRSAAAALLLCTVCSACLADIGTHLESSPEVQVYRALEKEFLTSDAGKTLLGRLDTRRCDRYPAGDYNYVPTETDGRRQRLNAAAVRALPCVQPLFGMCGFPTVTGPTPFRSTWAGPMKGVAFGLYIRELSRLTGVQVPAIEKGLQNLAERDLQVIAGMLKSTELISQTAALGRLYGESEYGELEVLLTRKWNEYVLGLPEVRRHEVPLLLFGGEVCNFLLGGPFEVKTEPSGAAVSLILNFDWLLCQALGRDPWSQTECPGWFVVASPVHRLAGTYRYEAKWPGRPVSRNIIQTEGAVGKVLILR